MPRLLQVTGFVMAAAWCAWANAQATLSHCIPSAVRPGTTIELTLHGDKLDDPLQVWTSFPAQVEVIPAEGAKDQKSRVCKVALNESVGLGIGGVVVGGPAGVSDVLLIMIDDIASIPDNGNNHSPEQAQAITPPIAIDGVADGSSFDYYQVTGKEGERLSVEIVAARLGSAFDSVVRLLRADGTELLLADDDISLGADSRFSLQLPRDGDYLIEVRDNQYRGGGRYRLRVGDFPLVTVPYPLGGRLGSTAQFTFAGPVAEGTLPVLLRVPDQVVAGQLPLAARFPDGKSSAAAALLASQLPETTESEPNEDLQAATPITIPVALNGQLAAPGDKDYYAFPALKDQSLSFHAATRSLGSPSLLFMRVFDESGKQLAQTQVNASDEWPLAHKFPSDGMYFLQVEDLLHRGGPEHAYRVEVAPSAGFALAVKHDNNTRLQFRPPAADGAIAIDIQCTRQGYGGPVELAVQDSSLDCRLLNPTIPAGAKEHRLILAVPSSATVGDVHALRVVGHATVEGRPQAVAVETQPTLRAKRPQLSAPPAWLNGLIAAAIAPEIEPFFATNFESPAAQFQRESGQAELAFALERKNEAFKDGVTVMIQDLPAGFSSAVKADKDKYTITISGPKDAPDGTHPLKVVSFGEFQGQGKLVVHEMLLDIKPAAAESEKAAAAP